MQRLNIAILGCFLLILFLAACNLFTPPSQPPTPILPVVGGDDMVSDPISGYCYRLVWIPATDHTPAALVTTDGVTCKSGFGNNR